MPLGLGGALLAGLGGGLTQLGQYQENEKRMKRQAEQFAAQQALQEASQRIAQAGVDESTRHNQALESSAAANLEYTQGRDKQLDRQRRVKEFGDAATNTGVGFLNPEQAYDVFNPPQPEVPSILDEVLGPMAARRQEGQTKAFMGHVGDATKQADELNLPQYPIEGSESYGGATAKGHPFSPYSAISANTRADAARESRFPTAYNNAVKAIQKARQDVYQRMQAAVGLTRYNEKELASMAERNRAEADILGRRTAMAELIGLRRAYPALMEGMTVEQLLGDARAQGADPGSGLGEPPLIPFPPAGGAQAQPAPVGRPNPLLPSGAPSTGQGQPPPKRPNPLLP